VLGAPLNAFFLPYIALVTLSAYAMIAILLSPDATALRDRLGTGIHPRLIGASPARLALLFTALWSALVTSALVGGTEFGLIPRVVTTLDLTIQLPALFIGGILLMRRHPLGYVVVPGLLLQASTYLAGLSVITVLQENLLQESFGAVAVVPGIVVGLISLAMMWSFVRAAARPQRAGEMQPRLAIAQR
jgi:hypothetical protein